MDADLHYLISINQSIARVAQFTKDGRAVFMDSVLRQNAVYWNLQLVSASARKVSDAVKMNHSEMPWGRVCRLCHEVIGNPWDVDSERVWQCVDAELPGIRDHIRDIIVERQTK